MRNWKVIEKDTVLRPGDVVLVNNGYESIERTLTEHDIELGSVSNGLHNERAFLYHPSYNVWPLYYREQSDLFAGE